MVIRTKHVGRIYNDSIIEAKLPARKSTIPYAVVMSFSMLFINAGHIENFGDIVHSTPIHASYM